MSLHPLSESFLKKTAGIALAVIAEAILWSFLTFYGGVDSISALLASSVYILLLATCGYIYWYIIDYMHTFMAKVSFLCVVQLVCLAGMIVTLAVLDIYDSGVYAASIPLCLVYGLLCFIILAQWYRTMLCREQILQMDENMRNETTSHERGEVIDKISVKEGTKIHIVRLDELLYIQSYGDYVLLFTDKAKFLKEQTMKFYEMHLPLSFVRIHRSCIVNSEKIIRVELFGKESYNVYLKNGVSLRASTTGYKLLKEKLLL